jgi:hypothetical protein
VAPADAIAAGDCDEQVDGLDVRLRGPDGSVVSGATGDQGPGAVTFDGLAAGSWDITVTTDDGTIDPVIACTGQRTVGAPGGEATVVIADGADVGCEWYVGGAIAGADQDPGAEVDPHNGNIQDPTNDLDEDGLLDADEAATYGTDPALRDTDGDGLVDGDEVTYGYDPVNPDTDGDGLRDGDEEYGYGTDPGNPDTDGDGASDGEEVGAGADPLDPDDGGFVPPR